MKRRYIQANLKKDDINKLFIQFVDKRLSKSYHLTPEQQEQIKREILKAVEEAWFVNRIFAKALLFVMTAGLSLLAGDRDTDFDIARTVYKLSNNKKDPLYHISHQKRSKLIGELTGFFEQFRDESWLQKEQEEQKRFQESKIKKN